MKKTSVILWSWVTLALTGCGVTTNSGSAASVLGSVLGNATNAQTIGNILGSVLGTNKPSETDLVGAWTYSEPGVAFTSDNLLAKAGGEMAATEARQKLATTYQSLGIRSSNTQLTLKNDKSFSGKLNGVPMSGTWTYDSNLQKLTLKTLLFTVPVYVTKTSSGMNFLMESKKLLSFLQTAASLSGNTTLETIGNLSKNYSGIRMGFDMRK
ncbi:MAG: DUF4923 family protein [Prevotella sp.]|nr:DUF4923 family protein [Prevotella sp.]